MKEKILEKRRMLFSVFDKFEDVRRREDQMLEAFENVLSDTINYLDSCYDEQVWNLSALVDYITDWARERGLDKADATKQMLKLMEETGELAQGMAKNRPDQIKDSIGDIFVVLVVLSLQLGLSLTDCVRLAYEEIKNRKGKMVNGVFVKESDLN